jgi:predicted phage terminase large subunit-like protein
MALATLTETLHRNRAFIPHDPTLKQSLFLSLSCREAMYGGAAGGGKSDALLMAAAQYVDVPGYAALLLRRSYRDLALPGALMDRAHAWWRGKAHWSSADKTYTFPSGATITFGYLANDADVYGYQGAEFQFVGFDELTQFTPWQYRYLFSRTRRLAETPVPVRMRAASNPGGSGHAWVYERFLATGRAAGRIFVPAKLADNPHLDAETYRESLAELDPITQQQLLGGVWITDESAHPYNRAWWRGTNRFDAGDERLLRSVVARYISWDTAFKDKDSSAYTACVVGDLLPDYRLLTRYAWRDKLQFPDLPAAIERIAREWNTDGKLRGVLIEDRASGTSAYQTLSATADDWLKRILVAFAPSGSKEERAQQAAVWGKLGMVLLPSPSDAVPWLRDFEAEVFEFPDTLFKDQTDAWSQKIIFLEHLLAEGYRARTKPAATEAA